MTTQYAHVPYSSTDHLVRTAPTFGDRAIGTWCDAVLINSPIAATVRPKATVCRPCLDAFTAAKKAARASAE